MLKTYVYRFIFTSLVDILGHILKAFGMPIIWMSENFLKNEKKKKRESYPKQVKREVKGSREFQLTNSQKITIS